MNASFYDPRYKDGKIVAFADVDVGNGIIVKGFRVVRGEEGLFAAVPSRAVNVQGQTRYMNQVVFEKPEQKSTFLAELLDRYRQWEQGRSGASHPPADELVE